MICKTPKNDWDKLCGFGRTITYQSINHWAIKSSLFLEQTIKTLKDGTDNFFLTYHHKSHKHKISHPRKWKQQIQRVFFILEEFDTFQENSNISQRTFNWLVIVFPDHILHISIVTSVLWNKESFFLNLFQGILFKMYSIILKNTVSGSLYWLKFKSQFDLTEHFNLKESLDYHITLTPLWFIN